MSRPASIQVIGGLYLAGGILSTLSGLLGYLAAPAQISLTLQSFPDAPSGSNPLSAFLSFIQHLRLLVGIQTAISTFTLIVAWQFLKLRDWARTALEGLSWFCLLLGMAAEGLWIWYWRRALTRIPSLEELPDLHSTFLTVGWVLSSLLFLVWILPLVIILVFLRGSKIKQAMIE